MRILVLGDSVTLHRARTGQSLLQIWPQLIKSRLKNADVWPRARPNLTARDIARELYLFSDSLEHFDYIVVQVGIVDASPRPHPYWIQKLIWTVGSLKLERFVNHNMYKLLRFRSKPWISEKRYRTELEYVARTTIDANRSARVIFIAIAPPCHDIVLKLPGVSESVAKYNSILSDIAADPRWSGNVHFINPYSKAEPEKIIIKDGHHLNVDGHQMVAESVVRLISQSSTAGEL